MSVIKEDLREKILNSIVVEELGNVGDDLWSTKEVFQAMDLYFEARSMELLEYMAKNEIECNCDNGRAEFARIGEGFGS